MIRKDGHFETVEIPKGQVSFNNFSEMQTVYENGQILFEDNFDDIRGRVSGEMV